jgi:lipoprotein-anchoring transpeptidase ErfK/SrfK
MRRRVWTSAAVATLSAVALANCGRGDRPVLGSRAAAPTTTTTAVPFRLVAAAHDTLKSIDVFDAPDAPAPKLHLTNPDNMSVDRVFLVEQQQGSDWLQVLLPVRPNGSTGWIRAADVDLRTTTYKVVVQLAAHRITVWDGKDVVDDEPVGVGTSAAPTPPGEYYISQALTVPAYQRNAYGPFAFGLNGHSNIYTSFGGGDGQLGIHGTSESGSIGKDASHGCIRLSNDGITKLIHLVPVGSPVEIAA